MGNIAECDVVVGCVLFGMYFSQSKNALLLDFRSFLITMSIIQIKKSIDGVLGI